MELGLATQTKVPTFIMKNTNSISTKIALVTFGCIGALPVLIMPILVGAMIDHLGLTGKEAGLVVSVEMTALGVSVFGMSLVLHRWNRRTLLLSGLVLFIVGQLASATADGFVQLAAIRVIAGLGGGILVSTMKAVIASIPEPVRILSIYGMSLLLASAASFSLMPLVISPWGIAGAYVTLGLLAFPSILLIRLIPRYAEVGRVSQMVRLKGKRILILMALVALLVYYLGFSPVWNYMERLGVSSGIDIGVVGIILSGVTIAGLVGAAFAASLSTRYGSAKPMVFGFICILGGLLLLASGKGFGTYSGGAVIFNFGNFFTAPYLLGMLARLDRQGRLIVAGFLMQNIGMAAGAALAAMMLTGSNYIITAWIGLIAFVFSFVIFMSVILLLDQFVVPDCDELSAP